MPTNTLRTSPAEGQRLTEGRRVDVDVFDTAHLLRQQGETDRALLAVSSLVYDLREELAAASVSLNGRLAEVTQLTLIAEAQRKRAEQASVASATAEERADNLRKLAELRSQEVATARAEAAAYCVRMDRLRALVASGQTQDQTINDELHADLFVTTRDLHDAEETLAVEQERLEAANAAILTIADRNDALTSELVVLSSELLELKERERQAAEAACIRDNEIGGLEARLREASQRIDDLLSSTSWRITAPMRALKDVFLRRKPAEDAPLPVARTERRGLPPPALNA